MKMPASARESNISPSGLPGSGKLGLDYDGRNLVFVVGCPRSGTTWLQKLLASHPKIRTGQESYLFAMHVAPELRNWRKLSDPKVNWRGLGLSCYFTEKDFLRLLKTHLLALLEPMVAPLNSGELFLEKTPSHSLFLPEIFELLPRARVIHILRDARDVVSSLLAGDKWLSDWSPKRASDASAFWVEHIKAFRSALPKLPQGQIHEVRYKTLSRSPIPVLRGCADFLGLQWSSDELGKAVDMNVASKSRANGGTPIPLFGEAAKRAGPVLINPQGFVRRAAPGGWKDDLSLYQKFWVWRVAHKEMEDLGYQWPRSMNLPFAGVSGMIDLAKRVLSFGRNRK